MNLSPRAQELLALQQTKYLQSFPEKKTQFERCLRAIQHHGWTPKVTATLKTGVHRLSGSAPSYGLIAVGEIAQKLDQLLASETDIESLDLKSGSEFRSLMDAMFCAMKQVIDKAG